MPTTTSSVDPPRQPLDRNAAQVYLWLNLLALRGLGSFLAGRRLAGVAQATLSLSGLGLTSWWFFSFIAACLRMQSFAADGGQHLGLGLLGVALFVVAWLWALGTSFRMLRDAQVQPPRTDAKQTNQQHSR